MRINGYNLSSKKALFDVDDLEEFVTRVLNPYDTSLPLSAHRLSLNQLRKKLIEEVQAQPTEIDELFLEKFWSQNLLTIWLRKNVEDFKQKIVHSRGIDTIQRLLKELKEDDFWYIGKSENKVLWQRMYNHSYAFKIEAINSCLENYRNQCTVQIMACNDSIGIELRFFDAFIKYLKEAANGAFIEKYRPLVMDNIQTTAARFMKMLEKILLDDNVLPTLTDIASRLKTIDTYFLTDDFFKAITRFFQPTKQRIFEVDGIKIMEVTGCFLYLSSLTEADVQEYHLISHISVELNEDFIRPGMNLVIKTARLSIPEKIIIDVSGKNMENRHTSDAGKDSMGNGRNGEDGYAGESAGNIFIEADEVRGRNNLTILANGGDGSDGQDGGHALDGTDGISMTAAEMKKQLEPAAAYMLHNRSPKVQKIIDYLDNNLDQIDTAWWTSLNGNTKQDTWQNIKKKRKIGLFGIEGITTYSDESLFVKVKLKTGITVRFAFEGGGHFSWTNCQSYLLVEGTNGTMGGDGGRPGRGGQPGFGGSIIFNQEAISSNLGKAGNNGKGGFNGYHGKNGWDVGWFDYSVSGAFGADTWPKYYGENHNVKLVLKPFYETNNNRITCPYRRYCREYEDFMMQMYSNTLEQPKSREIRTTHEKTSSLEHHAIATRKSNVELSSIRQQTSDVISSAERAISSLKETLIKSADVSCLTNKLSEEAQLRKELQVTKSVEFQKKTKRNIEVESYEDAADATDGIKTTRPDVSSLNSYQQKHSYKIFEVLTQISWTPDLLNRRLPKMICENVIQQCDFMKRTDVEVSQSQTFKQFKTFMLSNEKKLKTFFKESDDKMRTAVITAFLLDPRVDHGEFEETSKKYKKWANRKTDGLIIFDEPLRTLNQEVLKNSNLLKKVKANLKLNCIPPTRTQIEMYAQREQLRIQIYAENTSYAEPNIQHFNDTAKNNILRVFIKENGDIYQMKPDFLHYKLELHRYQKSVVFSAVCSELKNVLSLNGLENYLKNDNVFEANAVVRDKELQLPEKFNSVEAVQCIQKYVQDDKGVLSRLKFLTYSYIGTDNILRVLRDRIAVEGGMITSQELAVLINTSISLSNESSSFAGIMQWIIATNQQKHWIAECVIIHLEIRFRRRIDNEEQLRQKLRAIKNREVLLLIVEQINKSENLEQATISSIICSLDSSTIASDLRDLNLDEWPYVLNLEHWMRRLAKCTSLSPDELQRVTFYLPAIETVFTKAALEQFFNVLDSKKENLKSSIVVRIFQALYREECVLNEEFLSNLKSTPSSKWAEELVVCSDRERTLDDLVCLMNVSLLDNPAALKKIANAFQLIIQSKQDYSPMFKNYTEDQISQWSGNYLKDTSMQETLAVIDHAIYLIHGFHLRNTQKLAIAMFLFGSEDMGKRVLEQVSTGEGKSLIVASVAIVKSLRKEKVDVITSSTVLAKRDAEENEKLYGLFNITVGHNCSESVEERIDAYKNNNIVYGEITNFQRDYLLDRFYGRNILGNRSFENVIVDEVDSMLLDKGNNVLYLSHQIAGFDKLEAVLIYIWQLVNKPAANQDDFNKTMSTNRIKENVTDNLYKRITRDDISLISTPEFKLDVQLIWKELIESGLIQENGKLIKSVYNQADVNKLKTANNDQTRRRLLFLLKESSRKHCQAMVPNFLVEFVEDHLERWIENAKAALLMLPGNDYVVDVDRTGQRNDLNPNIVILDRDTGTDQASSQWEEGLHQFLQLKHGCRLSLMSLKAVFISNVSYFKFYKNLFGLTGTLGSQVEMELLQKIHSVEYLVLPTARGKRFEEEKPVICESEHTWTKAITNEVIECIQKRKRSVLVICETIESVNFIKSKLEANNVEKISAYRREHEEFDIAQTPLEPGHVIIATNLAGRGTDIKISNSLRSTGGLHVCLTYLPSNKRVEEQAFGRAARSGDPGSGRLVTNCDMQNDTAGLKILKLRKRRDLDEIKRISDIKEHYESKILAEEECFKEFHKLYDSIQKNFDDKKSAESLNLLHNVIDKWAMWLDKWKTFIDLNTNANVFREKLSQFVETQSQWPIPSELLTIPHAIKKGIFRLSRKDFNGALESFNLIIEKETGFSEAAHYFKALTMAKLFNWEFAGKDSNDVKKVRNQLLIAKRKFENLNNTALQNSAIVTRLKENFTQKGILQINAYEEQKKQLCEMYSYFISSIDDALGVAVTEDSFINGIVDNIMSEMVYEELTQTEALTRMSITQNPDADLLQNICLQYGLQSVVVWTALKSLSKKSFEENELMEQLKQKINLPSRDEFWQELISSISLSRLETYVIIDRAKLVEEYPTIFEKVEFECTIDLKNLLETSKSHIAKTVEAIEQLDGAKVVMAKDRFIDILVGVPYSLLLKKDLVTEIETGEWTNPKDFKKFGCFDELHAADFASEDIEKDDAELILKVLMKSGVVEKFDSAYKLSTAALNFNNLQLPGALCIYDYSVRSVLQNRFAYRIALNRLKQQVKEDIWPLKINLIHKPHQSLFWDLYESGIIIPVKVNRNADLSNVISSIWPEYINESMLLKKLDAVLPRINNDETFKTLIKEELITTNKFKLFSKVYKFNDKQINFKSDKISKILNIHIRNQMQLRNESTHDNIKATLKYLMGYLDSLEVPEMYLQDLAEATGNKTFLLIEELMIFEMNGLPSLIKFKEKQWTCKMIINTVIVILLGLLQIAIGVAIQLFSVGLMTNVGVGFIGEGVGDLMFAMSALRSGYFSWYSYAQHKKESLMITVATCGLGALCSRGAQISRYGSKLAEKGLEVGGKSVSQMCGMELVKEFGWKTVGKQVMLDVSLNSLKGIAFGLTSAEVARFVDNHLQSMCNGIADAFLAKVEENTNNHQISTTFTEVYEKLGPKEGIKLVESLTKTAVNDVSFRHNWATTFMRYGSYVSQGISKGLQKTQSAGSTPSQNMIYIASFLSQGVRYSRSVKDIAELGTMTDKFLDELNNNIMRSSAIIKGKSSFDNQKELNEFREASIDLVRNNLKTKAGDMISQKFVTPIMQEGAAYLVTFVGQQIKKQYKSYRDSCHSAELQKEQEEYRKKKEENAEKEPADRRDEAIEKEHNDNMQILKKKLRNSKTYADVVRDGGNMDMVCVKAVCADLGDQLAADGNQKGYKFVILGENGVSYNCECGNTENAETIHLQLKENHFSLMDSSGRPIENNSSGYDCLFGALKGRVPELNGQTAEGFRENIAARIETDSEINYVIRSGLHMATLNRNLSGGRMAKRDENGIVRPANSFEHKNFTFSNIRDGNRQTGRVEVSSYNTDENRQQVTNACEDAVKKLNSCLAGLADNDALRKCLGDPTKINKNDVVTCIDDALADNKSGKESITVSDLRATKYSLTTNATGKQCWVPVEWEVEKKLTVPLANSDKTYKETLSVVMKINIDNPGKDENGPRAPHIGYDFEVKKPTKHWPGIRKISGHIMMDEMKDLPGRQKTGLRTAEDLANEKNVVRHNWLMGRGERPRSNSTHSGTTRNHIDR